MSCTFLLMRHAKSAWTDNSITDRNRTLNERGQRVAPLMGAFLQKQGFEPDFVRCSSATRTMQTLELMLPAWSKPPVIEMDDRLYMAPSSVILAILKQTPPEFKTVLVLGHNPGMQNLTGSLSGQYHSFPTAAAALFAIPDNIPFSRLDEAAIRMLSIWHPKVVGVDN